ncbi:hypothetical protein I7I48_12193 [Histoplasma ohiense]|nr:hypothetical protein I7I48_12193 [Histoplasma ohiense (nom. inval.)]
MIDELNVSDPNAALMTTTKVYLIPPFGNEWECTEQTLELLFLRAIGSTGPAQKRNGGASIRGGTAAVRLVCGGVSLIIQCGKICAASCISIYICENTLVSIAFFCEFYRVFESIASTQGAIRWRGRGV